MVYRTNVSERVKLESLWRFIAGYQTIKGYCPSYEEMKAPAGTKSKGGVHRRVKRLESYGLIRAIKDNRARCLEVVFYPSSIPRSPTGDPMYFIPVEHLKGPPK